MSEIEEPKKGQGIVFLGCYPEETVKLIEQLEKAESNKSKPARDLIRVNKHHLLSIWHLCAKYCPHFGCFLTSRTPEG